MGDGFWRQLFSGIQSSQQRPDGDHAFPSKPVRRTSSLDSLAGALSGVKLGQHRLKKAHKRPIPPIPAHTKHNSTPDASLKTSLPRPPSFQVQAPPPSRLPPPPIYKNSLASASTPAFPVPWSPTKPLPTPHGRLEASHNAESSTANLYMPEPHPYYHQVQPHPPVPAASTRPHASPKPAAPTTPSPSPSRRPSPSKAPPSSSAHATPAKPNQCHGTTATGKRCTRTVSSGLSGVSTPTRSPGGRKSREPSPAPVQPLPPPPGTLTLNDRSLKQLDRMLSRRGGRQNKRPLKRRQQPPIVPINLDSSESEDEDAGEDDEGEGEGTGLDDLPRFCYQHASQALEEKGTFAGRRGVWINFDGP
jgi:hypothetical protein